MSHANQAPKAPGSRRNDQEPSQHPTYTHKALGSLAATTIKHHFVRSALGGNCLLCFCFVDDWRHL